jgi:hypothetical protein
MRRAAVVLVLVSVVVMGAPRHHRVRERAVVARVAEPEEPQEVAATHETAPLPDGRASETPVRSEVVPRAQYLRLVIAPLCAAYAAALVLSLFFGIWRELS